MIEKTKIKRQVIQEFGAKLDDMLESAEAGAKSHEGGKNALRQAVKAIDDLAKQVDEDIESGKLDEVAQEGTLKLGEYVKRWILRASGVCDNLATKAEVQKLVFEGRSDALRKAVAYAKDEHDRAMMKIMVYEKAVAAGEDPGEALRPQSQKSAVDDINARRAEARAAKNAEKEEAPSKEAEPEALKKETPSKQPAKRKPRGKK